MCLALGSALVIVLWQCKLKHTGPEGTETKLEELNVCFFTMMTMEIEPKIPYKRSKFPTSPILVGYSLGNVVVCLTRLITVMLSYKFNSSLYLHSLLFCWSWCDMHIITWVFEIHIFWSMSFLNICLFTQALFFSGLF